MKNKINGLISTPMSPFNMDGSPSLAYIDEFTKWQSSCGIAGFYILGTWGGFALLNVKERLSIASAYNDATKKYNMQLILNVASPSLNDTLEMAAEAEKIGITAISSTLPIYYSTAGYLNLDDYKRYFSKLAEKVKIPILLYNNPRTTNILINPSEFVELVKVGISGVKDGSKNIAWLLKAQNKLREESLNAEIIPGNSVGILYGFLYGCSAVTSGASVVFPKETFKIMEYLEQNNVSKATEQHRFVLKLREAIGLCPSPPSAAHFLLEKYGHSLGYSKSMWPSIDTQLGLKIINTIKEIMDNSPN